MTDKERYEKAQLLKAGQVVEISYDFFQAVKMPKGYEGRACEFCHLDCLCKDDVAEVCNELDWPYFDEWYLKLAHP